MGWLNGIYSRYVSRNRCVEEKNTGSGYAISSAMDNDLNDLADGVNACLPVDGTKAMLQNLPMGGKIITNYGPTGSQVYVPVFDQHNPNPTFANGSWTYTNQLLYTVDLGSLVILSYKLTGTVTSQSGNLEIEVPAAYAPNYEVPVTFGVTTSTAAFTNDINGILSPTDDKIKIYDGTSAAAVPANGNIVQVRCQAIYEKA